ncbi:MAG: nucleotidyl transferase AbiEii/AbiGii toxin family protein, partial [Proteobacteria bacterium]|nr:nucleotidyl transferase AbiEii/AbiGii toxin family protein [Pseudomonadota bacterium]
MHCLYGLQQMGLFFELKGGTSLSKGFGIIQRFSEDIDLRIEPPKDIIVKVGKKPAHVESRAKFYDYLAATIKIHGIVSVVRDHKFDDLTGQMRSGGIRLAYKNFVVPLEGLKEGILLELGFDVTSPNEKKDISSWMMDAVLKRGVKGITDNRALAVPCYHPGYTLVEKLQAVSTKFRKQQISGAFHENFLRHYYDIACLLQHPTVQELIGTPAYQEHKKERFRTGDNQLLRNYTADHYEQQYSHLAFFYHNAEPRRPF